MQIDRKYLKNIGIYLIIILVIIKFLVIPLHKELEVKKDSLSKKYNQYKLAKSLNYSKKNLLQHISIRSLLVKKLTN